MKLVLKMLVIVMVLASVGRFATCATPCTPVYDMSEVDELKKCMDTYKNPLLCMVVHSPLEKEKQKRNGTIHLGIGLPDYEDLMPDEAPNKGGRREDPDDVDPNEGQGGEYVNA